MPGMGNGERDRALEQFAPGTVFEVDDPRDIVMVPQAKKRVYLSGPMSGYPEFNFPAFEKAADRLRRRGWEVFSPAEQGWGSGDPATGIVGEDEYLAFMREDIKAVADSDLVVVLEGWRDSKGAAKEVAVARMLKIPVWALIWSEGELQYILLPVEPWQDPKPEADPSGPETVLQEADRLVSSDRADVYGHPLDDFGKVTGMALALWGRGPETPEEHALYMIIVKLARLESSPGHHDSIVDIAGYAKTYDMVLAERARRETV